MELWTQTVLILALSAVITGASEDVAIGNAIKKCNNKLGTNFHFKVAGASPRRVQKEGFFFNLTSSPRRSGPLLARLFPWLRQRSRYQFALTTTWKKPLTETTTVNPGGGDDANMIEMSCSAYLTNQEPGKYALTCNNVTREGKVEEKTVEVPLISSTDREQSEREDQDEEMSEEDTWDLSRCLGCIMELLSSQG